MAPNTPEIQALLQQVKSDYDALRQKREQWEELQTIPTAQAAYESELVAETSRLDALEKKRGEITAALKKQELAGKLGNAFVNPLPVVPRIARRHLRRTVTNKSAPASSQEENKAKRVQLQKLVNRWAFAWGLEYAVVAQINRTADDSDKPLGEALVLLEWRIFENRLHSREKESEHICRLQEWLVSLKEYQEQLSIEVDTFRRRYSKWLPIWERWKQSKAAPETHAIIWKEFIEETRVAMNEKIALLEREVGDLRAKLPDKS